MITPRFTLSQDESRVYITLKTPHIRSTTGSVEFQVEGQLFVFSLNPYYLRLRFPGALLNDEDERCVEDESLKSTSTYDAGECLIKISITKETKGQEFEDLDLVSKLLAREKNPDHQPAQSSAGGPLIQEMDMPAEGAKSEDIDAYFSKLQSEAEEFSWEVSQVDPGRAEDNDNDDELLTTGAKYGFNRAYTGDMGVALAQGGNDANEIEEPEKSVPGARTAFREQLELLAFDADYYLGDTFDNPEIADLVAWESPFEKEFKKLKQSGETAAPTAVEFTEAEREAMLQLPKKTYMLSNPRRTYIGLVGLLFAACYDIRSTQDDPTVESAWTICKLCPLLAALDDNFDSCDAILRSCLARALSFPLYRHWDLAAKCVDDVYACLRLGKRRVLQTLLAVKKRLDTTDPYYIYSRIWVNDYCAWVQFANDNVLRGLAHEVHKVVLDKDMVGLEIPELEAAAREAIAEHEQQQQQQ